MLKLIRCEFAKLKRQKFIWLVILAAFLFPAALAPMMLTPQIAGRYDDKAQLFDEFFQFVMGYGIALLLPCVIGVIAAILFFMERDNDTFKNLRTIPVTSTQMVFAKIVTLFLFGILFCVVTTIVTVLCGGIVGQVNGMGYKFIMAIEMGIFITAGTLPLVVLVVFFSKTYIFSVLLCIFYSVLSLTAESSFGALPKIVCWLMPIPLTTLWSAGDLIKHGLRENVVELDYLFPTTSQTVIILMVMTGISVALIDYLYKRRGE